MRKGQVYFLLRPDPDNGYLKFYENAELILELRSESDVVMDLKGLTLFSTLHKKMSWLTDRQRIVAENLANANTPGYRPRDLKEIRFSEVLNRQSGARAVLARTHPDHMKPPSFTLGSGEYEIRSLETKRNGNAVALDQELAKVAEVQMDYTAMVNLYRKHVSMIRTALGRGGN